MPVFSEPVGLVIAQYNSVVTAALKQGAYTVLSTSGAIDKSLIVECAVPGAYELPYACAHLIRTHAVKGVVALGALIKGETDHYDYIAQAASLGLMNLQLQTHVPITFGLLTCHTLEQALDRVGGKHGHKGEEAAKALLHMLQLNFST